MSENNNLAGGVIRFGLTPGASDLLASGTSMGKAAKPLRILILGGTGFTGPFQVSCALSGGHKVTVFNRSKTHPGELPKKAEQLIGDRNDQLDALKGRQWDVVIDIPTTLPVWVRDAAQILKGNVDRYVLSRLFQFTRTCRPGMDESGPLTRYEGADAMKETQAFRKQTKERQAKLKAGLTPERETEVLGAWHAQKK